MGREEKNPVSSAREGQRGRDKSKYLTGDTGGLIVGFDLLVNLHCLWKAAMMSVMRKPLAPNKKVMSGNERQ